MKILRFNNENSTLHSVGIILDIPPSVLWQWHGRQPASPWFWSAVDLYGPRKNLFCLTKSNGDAN